MHRGGGNPFDDDDDAGFGARGSGGGYGGGGYSGYGGGASRGGGGYGGAGASNGYGSRSGPSGYDQAGARGGYGGYDSGRGDPVPDYESRMMMANKRMEESSANSLRVLNETMRMGIDTTEELDRQAESLDRTERRLDEMHVDLDQGEKHMRKIKSPFGGMSLFSRKKKIEEVTDPKALRGKGKPAESKPAQKKQSQKQQQAPPPQSTGNAVVDRNLDEMEKALNQLHGIGQVISYQLDDSDQQLDRIKYKMDRNHVKVEKLNKDIKRELHK